MSRSRKISPLGPSEHERASLDVLKFNSKYGYSICDCCNKSGSLLIFIIRSTPKNFERKQHAILMFDLTDILITILICIIFYRNIQNTRRILVYKHEYKIYNLY